MVKVFSRTGTLQLSITQIIILVLTVLFLVTTIPLITKVNSPVTRLSLQEWRCSFSLMLDQLPVTSALVSPWCSTSLVKFDRSFIQKQQHKGESEKDAAMRFILNKMLTCKETAGGPKAKGFLSHNYCYICYSLETDETTPFITEGDLYSASLRMETASGLDYNTEFKKDGNMIVPALRGGLGLDPNRLPGKLDTGKAYGITYTTVSEGSLDALIEKGVKYGSGCAGAALAGSVIGWIVPVIGPPVGAALSSGICFVSLSAGAADYVLFDYFKLEEGVGTVFLTDYKTLEEKKCGTVVSG